MQPSARIRYPLAVPAGSAPSRSLAVISLPTGTSWARRKMPPSGLVTRAKPRPSTFRGLSASRDAASAERLRRGSVSPASAAWYSSFCT